jgi:hypothetical protein
MDTLLTESMFFVLQELRGISAKTVTQLELQGYHGGYEF